MEWVRNALKGQLPDSSLPYFAMVFVGVVAALAALSRLLYGKDDLTWRYTLGSIMTAVVVSWCVFALAAGVGMVSGYIALAIACAVGLFTDDFLKRLREYWQRKDKR